MRDFFPLVELMDDGDHSYDSTECGKLQILVGLMIVNHMSNIFIDQFW